MSMILSPIGNLRASLSQIGTAVKASREYSRSSARRAVAATNREFAAPPVDPLTFNIPL